MLYVIGGIALGILVALKANIGYSLQYAVYIALFILAIINAITNILSENLNGQITNIRSLILLLSDLIFACVLGYIGEQLGLPIYLAAVFAFGNNMYKNSRTMIDYVIEKYSKNKEK